MKVTEQQIATASSVMGEMIDRALDKMKDWRATENPEFSNDLWKAQFQKHMDEAFTEFEHGFESREQLSKAHTIGVERMEARMRALFYP